MFSCSCCNCHNNRNFAWQHFQNFLSLLKKYVFSIFEWSNVIIRKNRQRHPSFIFSLLFDGNCDCLNQSRPDLSLNRFRRDPTYGCHILPALACPPRFFIERVLAGSLTEPLPAGPNVWVSYCCVGPPPIFHSTGPGRISH